MKLYATVTSERASKGQGGNDFLDIDLFMQEGVKVGTVSLALTPTGCEVLYQSVRTPHTQEVIERIETKGERQKGKNA